MANYTSAHTGAVVDSAITKAAKLAAITGGDALKLPRVNSGETEQELIAPETIIAAAIVSVAAKATPVDADTIPLIDSAAANVLKELTVANLKSLVLNATDLATLLVAVSAKTTLVGADTMPVIDSEDSSALKEVTMANVLAYIGTPLVLRTHNRALFEKKDTTDIYLSGGRYFHSGTTDQYIYWNSKLTYPFTGLEASTWRYLYADDSAIVTKGSGIITATELTESATAPDDYDPIKGGCYHPTNTDDMCLFAVLTNADSEILGFTHTGNRVEFGDTITELSSYDIDATPVDLALTIPSFADRANCNFRLDYNSGNNAVLYVKPKGSADGGTIVGNSTGSELISTVSKTVAIGTDKSISLYYTVGGKNTVSLGLNAWFFGKGL